MRKAIIYTIITLIILSSIIVIAQISPSQTFEYTDDKNEVKIIYNINQLSATKTIESYEITTLDNKQRNSIWDFMQSTEDTEDELTKTSIK